MLQDDSMESTDMQIDRTESKMGVNRLEVRNKALDCTRWFDSHIEREREKNTFCTCGHVLTSEGR